MSNQHYEFVDLTKATNSIDINNVPFRESLYEVKTRTGVYRMCINRCATSARVEVWRKVTSGNGAIKSRYGNGVNRKTAEISSYDAAIHGWFVDRFDEYADAQSTIRKLSLVTGVSLDMPIR